LPLDGLFSSLPSRMSPVLFSFLFLFPCFIFLTECELAGEYWTAARNSPDTDDSKVIDSYDFQFERRGAFGLIPGTGNGMVSWL
jgi:hypothetical protein